MTAECEATVAEEQMWAARIAEAVAVANDLNATTAASAGSLFY